MGTPPPATVPEAMIEDPNHTMPMGYGQSKFVCEHVVAAAVADAGARACVLRIGQVVGDTKYGMWNDREAIPAVVRSALTMGVLPAWGATCTWLPVDTVADVILELGSVGAAAAAAAAVTPEKSKGKEGEEAAPPLRLVYNINSPHPFSWTAAFLPALRDAGLSFESVPVEDWLARLRALSSPSDSTHPTGAKQAASDPAANPALKLLRHFESPVYRRDDEREGTVMFATGAAEADSKSLRDEAAGDVIGLGLVEKMVRWWRGRWEVGGGDGRGKERL